MADGDLHLSESPNVDTGLVEKDGSLHRTVLTAVPEGTLQLSDSANVSTGYVTDSDGKKHKVNLVAEVTGSLELSDNPSVDTGYVTDGDGKKHKVKLTASLHGGGGGSAVIDTLNVTPSTSAQTITAPEGVDGYSPVNVAAVTSAIDANITAGNIKKDVSILGVTGSYEGQTPTGTMYIISNGTYNVADKAIANVQVPTTAPAHYVEKTVDANGKLINSTNIINLNGVTDIDTYVLAYAYYQTSFPANTSVDLSNLTTISGDSACFSMFRNCTGITSIDLSSLTTVSALSGCNSMFYGCTGITSIDLSSLTTVSALGGCNSMFYGCSSLTSVTLTSLTNITGTNCCQYMFRNCTSLTSLSLPALTSASFGTRTNQFNNMLQGVTGCTVHFPSNLQSVIGSWSDVVAGFGGTNTVLAFDLPATE